MVQWWHTLEPLTQWFFGAAVLFSLLLLWQLVMSIVGFDHGDLDVGSPDVPHDMAHDVADAAYAFKFVSVRSVMAFFTLFSWASALYLSVGKGASTALLYAFGWGLAGMVAVALLLHAMRKLSESGTRSLDSAVGQSGTVYLDIPEGGVGEVRVIVSGGISVVRARAEGGIALKSGASVTVTRHLDPTTLEVRPLDQAASYDA